VADFGGLTAAERKLALRDNMRRISGMPV